MTIQETASDEKIREARGFTSVLDCDPLTWTGGCLFQREIQRTVYDVQVCREAADHPPQAHCANIPENPPAVPYGGSGHRPRGSWSASRSHILPRAMKCAANQSQEKLMGISTATAILSLGIDL